MSEFMSIVGGNQIVVVIEISSPASRLSLSLAPPRRVRIALGAGSSFTVGTLRSSASLPQFLSSCRFDLCPRAMTGNLVLRGPIT